MKTQAFRLMLNSALLVAPLCACAPGMDWPEIVELDPVAEDDDRGTTTTHAPPASSTVDLDSESGPSDELPVVTEVNGVYSPPQHVLTFLQEAAQDTTRWDEAVGIALDKVDDETLAATLRERTAQGDFEWLPSVVGVEKGTLGDGLGAYLPSEHLVLIDTSTNSVTRGSIYLEEVGHALDALLRHDPAPGDAGLLFRELLMGATFTEEELDALRSVDDRGQVVFRGEVTDVHYFGGWWRDVFESATRCLVHVFLCGTTEAADSISDATGFDVPTIADAIDLIDEVTSLALSGPELVTKWVENGLPNIVLQIVDVANGSPLALMRDLRALHTIAIGQLRSANNASQMFERSMRKLTQGDYRGMVVDMLTGLTGISPDTVVESAAFMLQSVQQRIGLEPVNGVPLSSTEKELANTFFGRQIDLSVVEIKENHFGLWSVLFKEHVAVTVNNTVYFPDDQWSLPLLMHELVHVYQGQRLRGTNYKLEALLGQTIGHGYNWRDSAARGVPFADLEAEQQAQLLGETFDDLVMRGRSLGEPAGLDAYAAKAWASISRRSLPFYYDRGDGLVYQVQSTGVCTRPTAPGGRTVLDLKAASSGNPSTLTPCEGQTPAQTQPEPPPPPPEPPAPPPPTTFIKTIAVDIATGGDDAWVSRGDSEIDSDDWTRVTIESQTLGVRADGRTIEFTLGWKADEGNGDKSLGDTTIRSRKTFYIDAGQPIVTILSPLSVGRYAQWYRGELHTSQRFPDHGLLSNISVRFDSSGRNDPAAQRLTARLVFDVELKR